MKKYRYIIFDADDTLIDFEKDEKRAFRIAFGKDAREETLEELRRYEYAHWDEARLHETHVPEIQQNFHSLYYEHLRALFDYAEERYALKEDRAEKEKNFFEALCLPAHALGGALQTVKKLSSRYTVAIATNGLSRMQRGRLQEFTPYVKSIFISEELGAVKPMPAFGKAALAALGGRAEECLWIGDSLSSDIALANLMGIDCVWFNPAGKPLTGNAKPTFSIGNFKELTALL